MIKVYSVNSEIRPSTHCLAFSFKISFSSSFVRLYTRRAPNIKHNCSITSASKIPVVNVSENKQQMMLDATSTCTCTFEPPRDKIKKMTVRPAKTQISLGWSESSLGVQPFY